MTELQAVNLGKRFHKHWVIRNLDLTLTKGEQLLVTGSNGSGKSTLMKLIAGQMEPTEGLLSFKTNGKEVDPEWWYEQVSWMGPYHELYDDLTLEECISLHFQFKKPLIPPAEIPVVLGLDKQIHKPLRHFSSGMLHRAKVGLAVFSRSELLLLDEATTNMDQENSNKILQLTLQHQDGRILVYASNNPSEFSVFPRRIDLGQ
jgi:ABC-type multidrug transport system ATPase subunit